MMSTTAWAILGQALVFAFAGIGLIWLAYYAGRGSR